MATQSDQKKPQQPAKDDDGYESSDWESEEETTEPEYLSVQLKNKDGPAMTKALKAFAPGSLVYYMGGRGKEGPYEVSFVHSDHTYDLINGPKGKTQTKVDQNRVKAS